MRGWRKRFTDYRIACPQCRTFGQYSSLLRYHFWMLLTLLAAVNDSISRPKKIAPGACYSSTSADSACWCSYKRGKSS
ncbi:hypothetical protein E2C11_22305 [Streptomyces lavendulae]|nr:hypothetical protein E2C11_22305 [Streptomyces lavendulae]